MTQLFIYLISVNSYIERVSVFAGKNLQQKNKKINKLILIAKSVLVILYCSLVFYSKKSDYTQKHFILKFISINL